MIGDVVGGANKIVERDDCLAVVRMNEQRRDRKIFIPAALPERMSLASFIAIPKRCL